MFDMAGFFDRSEDADPKAHWDGWSVERKARRLTHYVSAGVFVLSAVVVLMQHGA